ncbi:MAG: TIGR04086 family membrane protein [Firmicutes bacterium]|nr:TIGR04086 family membrane protein [Bacillota bacterium]
MRNRLTFLYWSRPETGGARYQIQMSALVAGLMWAVTVTLFVGVILALWVTLSPHPTYNLSGVISLSLLAGALLGGSIGGLNVRRQGCLHGAIIGFVYGILFLLMMAGGDLNALQEPVIWARLLVLILAGSLGGIIGVNLPLNKTRFVRRTGR